MSTGLLRSMKAKLGGTPKTKGSSEHNLGVFTSSSGAKPLKGDADNGGDSNTGPYTMALDHSPANSQLLSQGELLSMYKEPLPNFRDVPVGERQALFVKKLQLCSANFDFQDMNAHSQEKEIKRQTLLELVDYVNSGSGKFTEAVSDDIIVMLSQNIFRALPPARPSTDPEAFDGDEEEPNLEPAWPHLQLAYEFLLRYVVSSDTDAKVAKKYIDQQFVVRLLDLFDSEDPRERDYLKTILHRIYGKFMVHRPFIRRAINYVFYRFVFETEKHAGIAELLEILGSIINGFALPLKEEHKQFLVRALLPLHKPKCLPSYHQQLAYCITQFVEKDNALAERVILGLLKFWPLTNSHKEVLFLGELEEVLELTRSEEFGRVLEPLFRQIARCLSSCHFQVAERSLFLWNNEYVVQLVAAHRARVLPLVIAALERNSDQHWNPAVASLSINVRRMFMEMDGTLYEKCKMQFEQQEQSKHVLEDKRSKQWEAIEIAAREANNAMIF